MNAKPAQARQFHVRTTTILSTRRALVFIYSFDREASARKQKSKTQGKREALPKGAQTEHIVYQLFDKEQRQTTNAVVRTR
jgi:hypothetical protein